MAKERIFQEEEIGNEVLQHRPRVVNREYIFFQREEIKDFQLDHDNAWLVGFEMFIKFY